MLFETFSITNSMLIYSYFNTMQMSGFELEILFVDWIHKFSQINTTILIQPAAKKNTSFVAMQTKADNECEQMPLTSFVQCRLIDRHITFQCWQQQRIWNFDVLVTFVTKCL